MHVWGEYSDVGTGIVLGLGRSMSEASGEKAPPDTPISRLLGGTIARHSALLKELGYDEVEYFHHIPAAELKHLLQSLKERDVPEGHLGKIARRLEALRSPATPTAEQAQTTSPPSCATAPPKPPDAAAPTATEAAGPSKPPKPPTVSTAAPPSEPLQSVDVAAFPCAVAFLKLVDVPGHRRPVYARDDPTMKLNQWQLCMNKHTLALIKAKPQLLRRSGTEWKLGAYHQEAAAMVDKDPDFHYTKFKGSRGANSISDDTVNDTASASGSSAEQRSSQRKMVVMTADVRTLRLAELPALIAHKKEEVRTHYLT